MFIPNAFTPNTDNINEIFSPVIGCEELLNYEFTVFNRWGVIIYESLDSTIGWNGHYQNTLYQEGIYIWRLKYTGKENDKTVRETLYGKVVLLK